MAALKVPVEEDQMTFNGEEDEKFEPRESKYSINTFKNKIISGSSSSSQKNMK